MDEDRNWLKNPILPRPPAVPRFSAAELRLVEGERASSKPRVSAHREQSSPVEARRAPRKPRPAMHSGTNDVSDGERAPQPRRIA